MLPTPHAEKLNSVAENAKLPDVDRPRLAAAFERYQQWRTEILAVEGNREEVVPLLVEKLQEYKLYVDLELIYDSPADFLYRQKGQTKLDNSIIEEFLPVLVLACFRTRLVGDVYNVGPTSCFSALRFESSCAGISAGGGATIRSKDQDFAISRPVYIRTSHYQDFQASVTTSSQLAYVAAECKTNLDKTMFQEAAATAADVKNAVPGAKYYLLCDWLDMTPISTSVTPIDEIIILRKAKRLSANLRNAFSKAASRRELRADYARHLASNPYAVSSFKRFIDHVESVLNAEDLDADTVLRKGFF